MYQTESEWFERELYIYTVNSANQYLNQYFELEKYYQKRMKNKTFDFDKGMILMRKYLSKVANYYVNENSERMGINKDIITNQLIEDVGKRLLDDIVDGN
jgi:hypothetical protein